MANPNKFTSKEVLNKVLLDSSGNAVTANSVTTQEALNSVLDTTNNRLNMSLAGGTISGDVTIDGDLTVNGNGSGNYDEIVNGNFEVSGEIRLNDKDGDGTFGGRIRYDNSENELRIEVNEVSGDDIAIKAHDAIFFQDSGGTKMTLDNGNLKIVQESNFTAAGNDTDNIYLNSLGASAGDGAYGASIGFSRASGGDNKKAAIVAFQDGGDADPTGLTFWTSSGTGTSADASEVMRITSDGKVGIGETAPVAELHIKQGSAGDVDTHANVALILEGSGDTLLQFQTPNSATDVGIIFGDPNDRDVGAIKYDHTNDSFKFHTDDVEKLRLRSDGELVVGGDSGIAIPELTLKSNTTGNGMLSLVSFKDSSNAEKAYLGYGSTSTGHFNILNLLGDLNFYAGSTNIRFTLDDNSRISLSNNDASGAVGTTLFGKSAGLNIATGALDNTFIGHEVAAAGTMTSAADSNTGVGFKALSPLTSGTANTMIGYRSGFNINTGSQNTALGNDTLKNCNDGTHNVAVGNAANFANAGDFNVAVGSKALVSNVGSRNVAVGYEALNATDNSGDGYNVGIGYKALTAANGTGIENVAIGGNAGLAMTTGHENVLIGSGAGASTTNSDESILIGYHAGQGANITVDGIIGIGYQALQVLTSGSGSTAVGYQALKALTEGVNNVAIGYGALDEITTGCCNIAIGTNALGNCDGTESENIAIGNNAGANLDDGDNNTIVGANANASSGTANGQIVIGKDVTGTAGNNTATLGISTSIVSIDLNGSDTSWAASSDERLKENIQTSTAGLSFINELRPVTFNWKKAKDVDKSMSQYQDSEEPALGGEGTYGKIMHGFVAQEVKSAIDKHSEVKEGFSMWQEWEDGTQAVSDGALVPMLVKAIQELSARVEELESK